MKGFLFLLSICLVSCRTPPTGKTDPVPKPDNCEFHIYLLKDQNGKIMGYVKVEQHAGLYDADQGAVQSLYWDIKTGGYNADSMLYTQREANSLRKILQHDYYQAGKQRDRKEDSSLQKLLKDSSW